MVAGAEEIGVAHPVPIGLRNVHVREIQSVLGGLNNCLSLIAVGAEGEPRAHETRGRVGVLRVMEGGPELRSNQPSNMPVSPEVRFRVLAKIATMSHGQ